MYSSPRLQLDVEVVIPIRSDDRVIISPLALEEVIVDQII